MLDCCTCVLILVLLLVEKYEIQRTCSSCRNLLLVTTVVIPVFSLLSMDKVDPSPSPCILHPVQFVIIQTTSSWPPNATPSSHPFPPKPRSCTISYTVSKRQLDVVETPSMSSVGPSSRSPSWAILDQAEITGSSEQSFDFRSGQTPRSRFCC